MKKYISLALIMIAIFMLSACEPTQTSGLDSTGIIEAVEVTISTQFPGEIAEIFVARGDSVSEGQELLRIEDQFLETQISQAQLAFDSAKSGKLAAQANLDLAYASMDAANGAYDSAYYQYQMILTASRLEEFFNRTSVWNSPQIDEFDLPSWYFSKSEDIRAAELEVENSYNDLVSKEDQLADLISKSENEELKIAEIALSGARARYLVVLNIYQNYQSITANTDISDELSDLFDEASDELKNAQNLYDGVISNLDDNEILQARVKLSVARQIYESALDYLASQRTGDSSPPALSAQGLVTQASAAIKQAKAGVELAQANLDQINLSVDLAESNLHILELQQEKMTIKSPVAGVVLVSPFDLGELAAPGQTLMTIGKLDQLSITIFIPEDQYGAISLGDKAEFTTDSYPNKKFSSTVIYISDHAEFTPTNVQTEEERRTTVYAVELSIDASEIQLIPGMPVQVSFE